MSKAWYAILHRDDRKYSWGRRSPTQRTLGTCEVTPAFFLGRTQAGPGQDVATVQRKKMVSVGKGRRCASASCNTEGRACRPAQAFTRFELKGFRRGWAFECHISSLPYLTLSDGIGVSPAATTLVRRTKSAVFVGGMAIIGIVYFHELGSGAVIVSCQAYKVPTVSIPLNTHANRVPVIDLVLDVGVGAGSRSRRSGEVIDTGQAVFEVVVLIA